MASPQFDICTYGSLTMDIIIDVPAESAVELIKSPGADALKIPLGEKVLVENAVYCPGGGAANCGVGFSKLGLQVAAVGNVGEDLNQALIFENLKQAGVGTDYIKIHKQKASGTSIILHSWDGKRTVFNKRMEVAGGLDFENIPDTKALYISHLYEASNTGLVSLPAWKHSTGGLIAWNPGKTQFKKGFEYFKALYHCVDMLILNVEELEYFTGLKSEKVPFTDYDSQIFGKRIGGYESYEPEFLSDVRALVAPFLEAGLASVFVTDGSRGTQAFTETDHFWSPPKVAIRKDSLGAGDAFSVGAVAARLAGQSIPKQMTWGTYNATNVIQHLGAQKGQLTQKDMPA